MSVTLERPAGIEHPHERTRTGLLDWVTTTDHKKIGLLYVGSTLVFFLVGGILALLIRIQLAQPDMHFLSRAAYDQIFTIHGTTMVFLVVAPIGLGLANYLVPLQIGAPDMAFPRLNMLSFWLFLGGGLTIYSGFLTPQGAAAFTWTAYPPLSGIVGSPGAGGDLWIMGVLLTSTASIMTGVNLMTTIFMLRAPGMTMWRMPLFTWNILITSLIVLVAFPPLAGALAMLFIDRHFGAHFYDPTHGGSALLYQHLFWFFGHPEVYIMALPFFGIISDVIPTFTRKPLFGYAGLVVASMSIAGLSMGVWAHHMFTTGQVDNQFFSAMSFLIAVPTGIKFFSWIGTMWGGRIRFSTPMLWSIGFLLNFLIGGVTGVMLASPPVDYNMNNTYFVVAHMHYVLGGGSLFALFAGLYYWFPKMTGYRLSERLGKATFWITFIGINVTFWPMFVLGLRGMPRRIATYDLRSLADPNLVATIGAGIMAVAVVMFLANVVLSFRRKVPAGDDPWDAGTLEWATSSPPPEHNFAWLPPIRSERPFLDWKYRDDPEYAAADAAGKAH